MITLHKYVPAWGEPDISPFCVKVDVYLRMRGIPFESRISDVRSSPKGKLPYIEEGDTTVCDSRDILAHLEARADAPLDAGISAADRATSVAYRALFEEELYFLIIAIRWQPDDAWSGYRPILMEYSRRIGLPGFVAPVVAGIARRGTVQHTLHQGAGRHTQAEINARAIEAADAVEQQLGDGPYFLGETLRTIDATAYAFLASTLAAPFDCAFRRHLQSLPRIGDYVERMRAHYYGR